MTKITEDMIGCLCWFFHKGDEDVYKNIDILEEIDEKGNVYSKHNCSRWDCCRPVKPNEIKFYGLKLDGLENENKKLKEELKEFENEELREKIHILNVANMRLENENVELWQKISPIEKGILTEEQREKLISTFKKSCISAWTSKEFQIPPKSKVEAEVLWIEIEVLLNSALNEMSNKQFSKTKKVKIVR